MADPIIPNDEDPTEGQHTPAPSPTPTPTPKESPKPTDGTPPR